MRPKANPEHFRELDMVLTLAEAARRYYVDPTTLSYAIDLGHLAALRCGRIVLISTRSLESYFSNSRLN